ncbi:MAG: nicotinamide-nucleotide adenylyltransferase [Nitrososphaerales archaeon]|nr:nicotinamide-nucleotide adenylyltransferase [Nitrososphaerales archaeon]
MTRIRDMKVGILIGRFQPLHKGHVNAIEFARDNSERLFVIVGSAEKSNQERNPFSFEERKRMIGLALKGKKLQDNISIVPINDARNHTEWIKSIKNTIGEYNLIFTNDELTEKLFKEDGAEVLNVPLQDRNELSATEVRKRLELDKEWESLVTPEIAQYLKEINAVERMKSIV